MSMLYRQCNLSRQTAFLPIVANSILQQQHPGGTFSRRPPSSQPQHSPGNSGQQHSVGQLPKLPRLAANRLAFTESVDHNTIPSPDLSRFAITRVLTRVWTPVGTGLSTPRDGAIMARPMLAGRQRRLTGHKYLRNKLSHRDVSSCRFFL